MTDRQDDGFEFRGEFYPLTVNIDNGKDLMLIDRITGMTVEDFRTAVADGIGLGRGPVMMAVLATSIRAKHPDWSVERIYRLVEADLSSLEIFTADAEEGEEVPPAPAGETPAMTDATTSPSAGSSSSQTPPGSLEGSETLYAIPA